MVKQRVVIFIVIATFVILALSSTWQKRESLITSAGNAVVAKMFDQNGSLAKSSSTNWDTNRSSSNATNQQHRHSYFTLMAGVHPYNYSSVMGTNSYVGYLLNLAATRYMLDKAGATADFNVLMGFDKSLPQNITIELPAAQKDFLAALQMNVQLLATSNIEKRHAVLAKFQVLRFVQYERVLFLDADTLPLCNLDYYFELSSNEEQTFAPNLVFAYRTEPSNAGFFMLKPKPGDWEAFQEIPAYMDEEKGFGKRLDIVPEGVRSNFTKWNWYYVQYDQGMLYHWVRYIKKDYTHVVRNRVQRWREVEGTMKMVNIVHNFTNVCANEVPVTRSHPDILELNPVYRHFVHYTGAKKVWMRFNWNQTAEELAATGGKFGVDPLNIFNLWGHAVYEAWKRYKLRPIRELIPNTIPASLEAEVAMIQRFLDS